MDIKNFKFLRDKKPQNRSEELFDWFSAFAEDVRNGKIVLRKYPHDQQLNSDSSSNRSIPSNGEFTSIETGDLFSQG